MQKPYFYSWKKFVKLILRCLEKQCSPHSGFHYKSKDYDLP